MLRRTTSLPCVRHFCTTRTRRAKPNLYLAPKEHSCGIQPWVVEHPKEPIAVTKLPESLIRPPCMPGQKRGGIQTCIIGQEGFYCPPCKLKYRYPPFSENIDFMPDTIQPPCWWRFPASCELDPSDQEKIGTLTRRWKCAYDTENWNP